MARPRKSRWVCCEPSVTFFKPRGIPLTELREVCLTVEELEAIRLKDLEGLDQEPTAAKMGISQPTLHRVVLSAHRKIADALVNGKALRIEGGTYIVKENSADRLSVAGRSSRRSKASAQGSAASILAAWSDGTKLPDSCESSLRMDELDVRLGLRWRGLSV